MQEEAGGVTEPEGAAPEQKKSARRKKKPAVPTVEAVVSAETAAQGAADAQAAPVPLQDTGAVEPHSTGTASSQDTGAAQSAGTPFPQDAAPEPPDEAQEAALAARRAALNLDSESALLETVLFLESEPQPAENLAKITQFSEDVIAECLDRLKEKYAGADSGIELHQIAGGWLLVPKKECFDLVKERYGKKNEGRLSKAAVETLAIIAHSQPITRAEIKSYRGVDPDTMIHLLLERNFITEVGKKDVPGKPVLYGTTKEFLEFFHLQSLDDLPQPDEQEERDRFELAR